MPQRPRFTTTTTTPSQHAAFPQTVQPHHRTDPATGTTHYYPGTVTEYAPLWPIWAVDKDGKGYSMFPMTDRLAEIVEDAARRVYA